MTPARAVAVEGVALELTSADRSRSLPELIFDCVRAALADAGVAMKDVGSICIAAQDLIDGRSLSSMITGPAAGAYLREEIRVSDDGLVALSLGAAQIQSGEFDRVVVAAWGRASEGDPERTSAHSFDPFTEQPLGLSDVAASALRASAYLRRHGRVQEHREAAVAVRAGRAAANPRASLVPARKVTAAYPLRADELRVQADAVAAVVLSRTVTSIAVTGIGHATEDFHLGERRLAEVSSARDAAAHALHEAGRELADIDVFEVGARTIWDEIMLLESIGAAAPGQGFAALAADPRINPSGGSAAGDCEPATGLVRFVEAVHQLTGRAGAVQLPGTPRIGLVTAGSVVAGQTHTAVVVEAL